MPYSDPNLTHNPSTGAVAPAAWGDVLRDNFEFLIDPPACSVFNSVTQTLTDNTLTVLAIDSENFDNDAMHSTVTNTTRITVQTAGRYEFTCRVNFQADTTDGRRVLVIRKNGSTSVTVNSARAVIDGNSQTLSGFLKDTMAAGDYMEVIALHTAGNNITVTFQEFTALFLTR